MTLYLHVENKRLLWSALKSSRFFQEHESNIIKNALDRVMSEIHNRFNLSGRSELTKKELEELNRQTLTYVIQMIQNQNQNQNTIGFRMVTERTDNIKQIEPLMLERDEPIQNLSQLVEEQKRERESIFNSSKLVEPSIENVKVSNTNFAKIDIHNDDVKVDVQDIFQQDSPIQQKVKWADENKYGNIEILIALVEENCKLTKEVLKKLERLGTIGKGSVPISESSET
jgi:hypothetical protein